MSPSGSDAGSCTSSAPCKSLDRAYRVASPGEVVQVAGGTYGDQNISYDASKTAPAVQIRAAAGATPVFGFLGVESSHVSLIGPFRARSLETNGTGGRVIQNVYVQDVTVDHQAISSLAGYIAAVDGLTWRNVDLGNVYEAPGMFTDGGMPGGVRNVVLDGISVHDVYIAPNSPTHVSCFGMFGGWNITVRNSHFYNCTTFDIFVTYADSGASTRISKNVVLENNVFEETIGSGKPPNDLCCSHYNVMFRSGAATGDGAIVRNNTFEGALSFNSDAGWAVAPKIVGNIVNVNCRSGVTYARNVTPSPCAGTDKQTGSSTIRAGFQDPSRHDFHLTAGSPAVNAGDPTNYTATDKDGKPRPSSAPDAGAYER